jgi:hypothetical protein
MIWWRMQSGVLLTSLSGCKELLELALSRDNHGGCANRSIARQDVPPGAEAWSGSPAGPWRSIEELPKNWRSIQ